MQILIDADACPVVDITLDCAVPKNIPVVLVCDSSHELSRANARTIYVDKGSDSADYHLVNLVQNEDIVVTQDYGLAAMALARGARVLNQNGMRYTADNIDALLLARHTARKIRMGGGRLRGPSKRTSAMDDAFREALSAMLDSLDAEIAQPSSTS